MTHRDEEGAAYRWALFATLAVMGAVLVSGAAVGFAVRGMPGLWGAVAGVGVAALSGLTTPAAMMLGYKKEPHVFASYVGASWLAKMVVIVVGLLALAQLDSLDRGTFGIIALVAVGATLVVDLLAVRRARISYTGSGADGSQS